MRFQAICAVAFILVLGLVDAGCSKGGLRNAARDSGSGPARDVNVPADRAWGPTDAIEGGAAWDGREESPPVGGRDVADVVDGGADLSGQEESPPVGGRDVAGASDGVVPLPIESAADLINRLIDARCAYRARCGQDLSKEDCRKIRYESGQFDMAELSQNINAGRTTYDATQAMTCLAALTAAACTVDGDAPSQKACDTVFGGTQPSGATCFRGEECETGYCEQSTCSTIDLGCQSSGLCQGGMCTGITCWLFCCPGVCKAALPLIPIRGMCSGGDCIEGASCHDTPSNDVQTCVADAGKGESCKYASCQAGLTCDQVASKTCVPYAKNGQTCGVAGPECDLLTSGCETASATCKSLLAVGAACADDSLCPSYTRCSGGTCTLLPGPGEPCSIPDGEFDTRVCRAGQCIRGFCRVQDALCTIEAQQGRDGGP